MFHSLISNKKLVLACQLHTRPRFNPWRLMLALSRTILFLVTARCQDHPSSCSPLPRFPHSFSLSFRLPLSFPVLPSIADASHACFTSLSRAARRLGSRNPVAVDAYRHPAREISPTACQLLAGDLRKIAWRNRGKRQCVTAIAYRRGVSSGPSRRPTDWA